MHGRVDHGTRRDGRRDRRRAHRHRQAVRSRPARATSGYKDALLTLPDDGTVISRGYTGKTCRVVRNTYTQYWEEHPDQLQPFPAQVLRSVEDGANHLGSDDTAEVDPDKEFWPAGQGAGAIDELVPAGELVHRFVEEAEAAMARV
ncbi:MAG: hypothetical protein U5K29_09470 [Acidimicrobiales bacterium]|nr:hypothetical protein [Acidimicrobiales bacterium]